MRSTRVVSLLALLPILAVPVFADVIWDESVDGDLSTDPLTPTVLTVVSPADTVSGTIGGPSTTSPPDDFWDTFTFNVPAGKTVSMVILLSYIPAGGNTSSGFNVYSGAAGEGGTFLGSTTMTVAGIGTDMLAAAGVGPLVGPGDWSISLREGTPDQMYSLSLEGDIPVEVLSFSVD